MPDPYDPYDPEAINTGSGNPAYTGGGDPEETPWWLSPSGGTSPTGSGGGGGGLGDIYSWLSNLIGGGLGMDDPMSMAMLAPAFTSAYKQWTDADKWKNSSLEAIKASQPYRDRDMYSDRLKSLTEDPNAYLANSPDYQAALKQGLGGVERSNAALGNMGSGNMLMALNDYGQMTAAKYLDNDRKSLMEMAKGNPRAGDYIMQGDENAINSQNQALNAMFMPFLMQQQARNANPGNGTTPGGGGGDPLTTLLNNAFRKSNANGGDGNEVVSALRTAIQAGGAGKEKAIAWAVKNGFMIDPKNPELIRMPENRPYNPMDPEDPRIWNPDDPYSSGDPAWGSGELPEWLNEEYLMPEGWEDWFGDGDDGWY